MMSSCSDRLFFVANSSLLHLVALPSPAFAWLELPRHSPLTWWYMEERPQESSPLIPPHARDFMWFCSNRVPILEEWLLAGYRQRTSASSRLSGGMRATFICRLPCTTVCTTWIEWKTGIPSHM